jgi:hypothetical protein
VANLVLPEVWNVVATTTSGVLKPFQRGMNRVRDLAALVGGRGGGGCRDRLERV